MNYSQLLKATALLVMTFSLTIVQAGGDDRLTLVYSGNLDGELEPCGCSAEGDLGGMLRRATTLKALRENAPELIAVSSGGLLASVASQDRLTGEYILKAFPTFSYDAVALQWSDLAYGKAFILKDNVPWVTSNWSDDSFTAEKKIERNGRHISFFSWLDLAQSPQSTMQGQHAVVSDDVSALQQILQKRYHDGVTVILSTALSYEQAREKLPLQYVDVLIIESAYEVFSEPQLKDGTLVLQPGSRGMRLAKLELEMNSNGRIESHLQTIIAMPSTVEDSAALMPWYQEYNDAVKASYLARVALRKAKASGNSPYVGEEGCMSCHTAEYAAWKKSLHRGAFGKLEDVNKAFDPACIKCHTVGFEKEGGFIDVDASDHLMGVQCESCHGAGRDHARSAGIKPLENKGWQPRQMCAQCHIQKHSPGFDFDTYWPRVQHGANR